MTGGTRLESAMGSGIKGALIICETMSQRPKYTQCFTIKLRKKDNDRCQLMLNERGLPTRGIRKGMGAGIVHEWTAEKV